MFGEDQGKHVSQRGGEGGCERLVIFGWGYEQENGEVGVADPFSKKQALLNAALDQFAIPGDASFPLNQAFEAPRDRQDAETLRQ